jgi:predicted CxxxxCH...CXXCH cytochrome family protein
MRIHRTFTLGLATLAVAACDATRPVVSETRAGVSCARCHGGEQDESGAPPRDVLGRSDTSLPSVGAHTAHVAAGLDCGACHVKPARSDDGHVDGRVAIVWGPLATANGALSPYYDAGSSYGCASTYCHGRFTGGNAANAPLWTAAGQGQGACGTCHGDPAATPAALPRSGHPALAPGATGASCAACHPETVDAAGAIVAGGKHVDGLVETDARARHPSGWTDPASPAFHGETAAVDARACGACHAVRAPAAVTNVTCADCHLGGQSWTTTCNGCHGQAGDPRGAPPADVRGNTAVSAVGVGAHRRHVDGSAVSGPLDCAFCHEKPADAYDAGHLDGAVTVTAYTGQDAAWIAAGTDPGWNASTATCATSYCHSAWAPANVPVWTEPRGNACGTCHGLPPGGAHPAVSGDLRGCNPCHSDSMTVDGQVIPAPAGAHLDGHVTVMGGHVAAWMSSASPEFHAFAADRGLASCQGCHGSDLSGGFANVACASCHGASWKTSCRMCHGDKGDPSATGAPPRTIWGYAGDPVRTGGHGAHVDGSAVYGPIACAVCHVKPTDAFSPGHIDVVTGATAPTASVAFTGLAVRNGAGSTWNRATPTCSVYCHGSTFSAASAGSNTAPSWTGGPTEATCGTCHGTPPGGTHPANSQCGACHLGYTATSVDPGTHLDGTVQQPTLDCSSCHGDRSRPATEKNPRLPAAPPAGTHGETATTTRAVGAHQLHLAGGTLSEGVACGECHVVPTTFGAGTGHPSGAVELLAGAGTFDPGTLTCANTYCHGNFQYGHAANAPVWTAPAADACGSCHGLPPASPHPQNTECERCHVGYTATTVNRATHVNGQRDVELSCTSCHGDAARTSALPTCPTSSPLCVDPNLKVAPPVTASGRPPGAHLKHVNPAAPRSGPAQCAECHQDAVPTPSSNHPTGALVVAFGGRATTFGASPPPAELPLPRKFVPSARVAPSYDGLTSSCSATYCHGNYGGVYHYEVWDWGTDEPVPMTWSYSGKTATPKWGDGPTTCASCHGNPPLGNGWHVGHGNQAKYQECQVCHPDASGNGATATITQPARHANGIIDLRPNWALGGCCH